MEVWKEVRPWTLGKVLDHGRVVQVRLSPLVSWSSVAAV